MKIARIESFIFGTGSSKDLLFCRVETEDGTYGWGEGYVTAGKENVIAECVRAMAPHVIGRSVFNIRHTGQIMFEDFAIRRGSMELLSAWSAIEIASWDIIGKRAGLPVYNLLGGASRERVRVYANGWAGRSTIEEGVERGRKVKAMGFTAAKFDPFPGPWRSHVDRKDEDFAIAYVAAMREALGPRFRDTGRGAPPLCALPRDPHRPAPRRTRHRLVRGALPRRQSFPPRRGAPRGADPDRHRRGALHEEQFFACLAMRAADILNPDICAIGGITAMMDIAAMAQPQAVVMSPHNYNSPLVGMAATVHVSAVIPNFRITEYFVNFTGVCDEIATQSLAVKDGWIDLPRRPGSASTSMSSACAPTRTRRRPNTASASTGKNTRARGMCRNFEKRFTANAPRPPRGRG